jgi:hypothetical protein
VSSAITPGPPASPDDLRAAQERTRLLGTELQRVRTAAAAWRNGLAGLLTVLAGFSLIKGKSDVGDLAQAWAVAVGAILLGAYVAGAAGAVLLIRAANGNPSVVPIKKLTSRSAADHDEALSAASALRSGIVLTLACSGFLVVAVAMTWYGPSRMPAVLQVTTPAGTRCGSLVQAGAGGLTITGTDGTVTVLPAQSAAVRPALGCSSP